MLLEPRGVVSKYNFANSKKSKITTVAIWKIEKSQYLHYGWTNFDKTWNVVPQSSRPSQQIKFNMVANCHLENIKNIISQKSFAPISAEF